MVQGLNTWYFADDTERYKENAAGFAEPEIYTIRK